MNGFLGDLAWAENLTSQKLTKINIAAAAVDSLSSICGRGKQINE